MVVLHFKGKLTTPNLPVTKDPDKSTLTEHCLLPRAVSHSRPEREARKWTPLFSIKEILLYKIINKCTHRRYQYFTSQDSFLCFPHFQRHRRRQWPIYFQFTDTLTLQKQHLDHTKAGVCCKSITELWQYNKTIITCVPLKFKAWKTVLAFLFWL